MNIGREEKVKVYSKAYASSGPFKQFEDFETARAFALNSLMTSKEAIIGQLYNTWNPYAS